MRESGLFSAAISLFAALLILSGSIAAPILCRPFYYLHISALHLSEQTGWSEEVIRDAYDEMLDFCTLGTPFGTGELKWSAAGESHFADCAVRFRLDFAVCALSAAALLVCLALWRRRGLRPHRFRGRGPGFWAGSVLGGAFALLALLAALNFDRAFVVFHTLLFPGKENWLFDPDTDQIIRILPEVFFRNCAILIVTLLVVSCAVLILTDLRRGRRSPKK